MTRRHGPAQSVVPATVIGAGPLLNWLAIGDLVRYGTGLPAVFYVAFVIGARRMAWPRVVLGGAALILNLICQACSDPQLGANVLLYMVPITLGFGVARGFWRQRRANVARLRVETARLRDQRDATARIAVAADRARIASDFSSFLHDGVEQIAAAAAKGRSQLEHDPEHAQQAFVDRARCHRRSSASGVAGTPAVEAVAWQAWLRGTTR